MRPASANFLLADSYVGGAFLQTWTWETFDDPTHGRVDYVDQQAALTSNLTFGASHPVPQPARCSYPGPFTLTPCLALRTNSLG